MLRGTSCSDLGRIQTDREANRGDGEELFENWSSDVSIS